MCVVSNIGRQWGEREKWPWKPGKITFPALPPDFLPAVEDALKGKEYADLEKRIKALEDVVKKAKEYDERTGQPGCETEDKWKEFRKLADELGVKLDI